jgi:rhodanese-related sulfurtransferase
MVKKINIGRLSRLMKRKKGINLVDVMAEEIHQNIHIKGAVNIPYSKMDDPYAFAGLNPKAVIVTYSIDYDCPVSRLAAIKIRESGFKKVFYYQGGLKEWLEANMPLVRSDASSEPR